MRSLDLCSLASTGGCRCRACRAEGKGVIIVEGILIFTDPGLRDLLDVKVFVDTVS